MKNSNITDLLFLEAVQAIDAGNIPVLQDLLFKHPQLVRDRLDLPDEGYFKNPYLLWFVADNPIRNNTLATNIVEVTQLLIQAARQNAGESFQQQIDYALGLVVTGSVPRECGVQLELMDVLINAGAVPGSGHGALAHGNREAAQRLLEKGGVLTLTTAICLNRTDDISELAKEATVTERQTALVAAAFYGMPEMLTFLINLGTDINGYIDSSSGFHSHATALHQAIYSGSPEAVKILVEAGADLAAKDLVYEGTPLGWAMYMQTETNDEAAKKKYAEIEACLRNRM